ncbi:baseplate hub [Providencia phage PSTCR6]|nr:baseplate hub [Providencia phage PSTCR6]
MNLNLILPLKKVTINNKQVSIPKLGLSHYNKLKDPKSPEESIKIIVKDLFRDLSNAESLIALLHLMEFNNQIKGSFEYKGKTYTLNDIVVLPKKTYILDQKEYKFNEPELFQQFFGPKDVLETLSVDGTKFGDMPAFVIKWADELTKTIALHLPDKTVYGDKILELFE